MGVVSGGGGSTPSVLAIVELTGGAIFDWAGTAVPFNTVTFDPHQLWSISGQQFTAVMPGWYLVTTGTPGSGGGISAPAAATDGTLNITAIVGGAGDNLHSFVDLHTDIPSGIYTFPPIVGYTHLDAGDTVSLIGGGGAGWQVGNGTSFTVQLVADG